MYPFQLKTEINRRIDEEQKMKNPDKQQSNKPKLNEYGFGRGTFLPVIGKNRKNAKYVGQRISFSKGYSV